MTDEIRTPDCPRCGQLPAFTGMLPYFCSNDGCKVLTWDPTKTLAEIRAQIPDHIDLPFFKDEER